jgi:hypothetical protein
MAGYDLNNPGEPHGKSSPFRWDPSSAAAVLVLGALAFLIFVNFNVGASATIGASRR